MNPLEIMDSILIKNGIITAFLVVGIIIWFSYFLSEKLTNGKFHGSAIAIIISLIPVSYTHLTLPTTPYV